MSSENVIVDGVEWKHETDVIDTGEWTARERAVSVVPPEQSLNDEWVWTVWRVQSNYPHEPDDVYEAEEGNAPTRDEAMAAAIAADDRLLAEERAADAAMAEAWDPR